VGAHIRALPTICYIFHIHIYTIPWVDIDIQTAPCAQGWTPHVVQNLLLLYVVSGCGTNKPQYETVYFISSDLDVYGPVLLAPRGPGTGKIT